MSRHALGLVLLVLVTGIWGSTFAIVKNTAGSLSPALLIAWRFSLGGLTLLPLLWRPRRPAARSAGAAFYRDGALLGALLTLSYAAQTVGLQTTSANRAAFITGLNVIMVPLWLALTSGLRPGVRVWGAVALALVGIALLSWEGGALVAGDAWAFLCALGYAAYIIALERLAPRHSPLSLTALQVLSVAALAWLWALLDGAAHLPPAHSWGALVYLAVIATAVTTLLQTLGQRWVSATEAAIIYALEPVAASVFSFILLGETVGLRGLAGGALVVAAMVLSQLPARTPTATGVRGRGLAE